MKTRVVTLSPRTATGIRLRTSLRLRSSLCLWGRFMTMKDRNKMSWASKQVYSQLVGASEVFFFFTEHLIASSSYRWRVHQNWRGGRSGLVQRPAEGWTKRPLSCKLRGGHSVDIYPQRENQCEQRRKCFMMQAVNENTALFLNPFLTVGEDWTITGRRNISEKEKWEVSSFSSLIQEVWPRCCTVTEKKKSEFVV